MTNTGHTGATTPKGQASAKADPSRAASTPVRGLVSVQQRQARSTDQAERLHDHGHGPPWRQGMSNRPSGIPSTSPISPDYSQEQAAADEPTEGEWNLLKQIDALKDELEAAKKKIGHYDAIAKNLQRENADLSRRVEGYETQMCDILKALGEYPGVDSQIIPAIEELQRLKNPWRDLTPEEQAQFNEKYNEADRRYGPKWRTNPNPGAELPRHSIDPTPPEDEG